MFSEQVFMNIYKVIKVFKTDSRRFHIEIYIKLKPTECKITNLHLYILELYSSVVKSAKTSTILYHFVQKNKKTLIALPWLYGINAISLKTGIEHRFSFSQLKCAIELHVLLGKLRNFPMEFSNVRPVDRNATRRY